MSAFVSKKYSYREGYSFKVPAQIVGETFERIIDSGVQLTAQSFLDESRPEESPTHALFEWDDSIAAEKYRLHQSKNVILQIECVETSIETSETDSEVEVVERSEHQEDGQHYRHAYVNVNQKRPGQMGNYVPVQTALSNDEMRIQVLRNAISALRSIERRVNYLEELAEVCKIIRDLDEKYSA